MDYFQGVYNIDWDFEKTDDGFELIVSISFDGMDDGSFAIKLAHDEFMNMVDIVNSVTNSLADCLFYLDAYPEINEYLFRKHYSFVGDIDKEVENIGRSINNYWGIPQCSYKDLQWLERQLKTIKD